MGPDFSLPVCPNLPNSSTPPGISVEKATASSPKNGADNVRVVVVDPKRVEFQAIEKSKEDFSSLCTKLTSYSLLINGNFFSETNDIMGVLISKGRGHNSLSTKPVLSGIFIVDQQGNAKIIRSRDFKFVPKPGIDFAVQAGPLIIEPGRMRGIKSDAIGAQRTVLAVKRNGKVMVFTFTNEVTLLEVQEYLLKKYPDLDTALNLDGGPSTASCVRTSESFPVIPPAYLLPAIIKITAKQ